MRNKPKGMHRAGVLRALTGLGEARGESPCTLQPYRALTAAHFQDLRCMGARVRELAGGDVGYPDMKYLHSRCCSGRGQVRGDCHHQASPRGTRPHPGLGSRREISFCSVGRYTAIAECSWTLFHVLAPRAAAQGGQPSPALPEVPPFRIIPPGMSGRAVCGGRGSPALRWLRGRRAHHPALRSPHTELL